MPRPRPLGTNAKREIREAARHNRAAYTLIEKARQIYDRRPDEASLMLERAQARVTLAESICLRLHVGVGEDEEE